MIQIALVDSEFSTNNDDIIRHIVNDDERIRQRKEESSSSSSTSNCQSLLTIHQCSSTTTTTDTQMLNNTNSVREKSPARFSYLIRPITPCIFGTEDYDDEQTNDDEFFLTAGGIVHSCPNVYELSIAVEYQHRKVQSCDHFMFIHRETASINNNLNTYDTEFDRYSILPRFQPMSSSLSTDSISSEIELYRERHAIGLSAAAYSSFLPTTWRSDNYLLFMPFIDHHQYSPLLTSIDGNKRSRSYELPIRQTVSSIVT